MRLRFEEFAVVIEDSGGYVYCVLEEHLSRPCKDLQDVANLTPKGR